ncbi:MAG: MOSC domain-containing protein [Pseudomonadota bacterium]
MDLSVDLIGEVAGVFAGKSVARWAGKPPSAIAKTAQSGPCRITARGLEGDEHADQKAHGGPDQALHFYPADHLPFWRGELPERRDAFRPGGFGENVSLLGLTEETLCVGDVLGLGTARLQISQGRVPCWKLNAHTGSPKMAARFLATGKTGWYCRVLAPGIVTSDSYCNLLERPAPDWPLSRVIGARFAVSPPAETIAALAALPTLSSAWRSYFQRMRADGSVA